MGTIPYPGVNVNRFGDFAKVSEQLGVAKTLGVIKCPFLALE